MYLACVESDKWNQTKELETGMKDTVVVCPSWH